MKKFFAIFAAAFVAVSHPVNAADLGGGCCADLEERIAELEASTAKKGNRKVSVVVYGQVNKAIAHVWGGSLTDTRVLTDNTASETFVGVAGSAKISADLAAGYVLEIQDGVDGSTFSGSHDVLTRQSYAYISSARLGSVSIGLRSMATDAIYGSVANTSAAFKPMTLQPYFPFEPLNGTKRDSVRYDSPSLRGFVLSAAWATGSDAKDVALRWAGQVSGFSAMASAGWSDSDSGSGFTSFGKTYSLSAGAKHDASGLFLNAYYGKGTDTDFRAWQLMGGLERKLTDMGPTTLYVNYGDADGLKVYGAGVVQNLVDGIDVYADLRHGNTLGDALMGGVRVGF